MTKYKIFCRADSKGARWCEYSGIFETMEDAADFLIFAASQKVIAVNGKSIIYKVKPYETTEKASRSAECINYSDVQAEVYEKVKATRKNGETEKLNEIRDKYGYDLYKWALDELDKQEWKITDILFTAACCGDINLLKMYYENGGKINRRYFKFGIAHSLIAGAFRNGEIETVKYLKSVGETTEGKVEYEEIKSLYMDELIGAAKNLVDYFNYHNKNITKAQEEKIGELKEILKLF